MDELKYKFKIGQVVSYFGARYVIVALAGKYYEKLWYFADNLDVPKYKNQPIDEPNMVLLSSKEDLVVNQAEI